MAQAGRFGRVTIATNMAGRGTDILLGGNAEFIAKQECLKKGLAQPVQDAAGAVQARPDDPTTTYWYYQGAEYRVPTEQWQELVSRYKAETEEEHKQVIAAEDCSSSAPSGTRRGASTTSFADAPAVRAIRVRRVSIFRWKTT